jgi:uncharacterized protein YutE (UPF0331/DUF86 family)
VEGKEKVLPRLYFLESELSFQPVYSREIDWKVYQSNRGKRLEIERWVENIINATIDICKMFLVGKKEEIPEATREILFKIACLIYQKETEAELFSELAKIRNTLAHHYLDIKWEDIKRFIDLVPTLYPLFLGYIKKQLNLSRF